MEAAPGCLPGLLIPAGRVPCQWRQGLLYKPDCAQAHAMQHARYLQGRWTPGLLRLVCLLSCSMIERSSSKLGQ